MRCTDRLKFFKPLFLPLTNFSHLPDYAFKEFLVGEATSVNPLNLEFQRKYPCPPTIDQILNRNSYNPPTFLDNLISAAAEQARRKPSRDYYIESGGWLLLSKDGRKFRYQIKPEEERDQSTVVYLDTPEIFLGYYLKQGWLIVADFHTHPARGNTVDQADINRSTERKMPGFIIDFQGIPFGYGVQKGIYKIGVPRGCK